MKQIKNNNKKEKQLEQPDGVFSFQSFFQTLERDRFFHTTYQYDTLIERAAVNGTTPPLHEQLAALADFNRICDAFEKAHKGNGVLQVSLALAETHRGASRDKQRQAKADTQTDTQSDTHGHRHTQSDTQRHTETHIDTDTHSQTHTLTDTHTHTHRYTRTHGYVQLSFLTLFYFPLPLLLVFAPILFLPHFPSFPPQLKEQGQSTQVRSCTQLKQGLDNGAGLLIRFEDFPLSPVNDLVAALQDGVQAAFGTQSTIHTYLATQQDSRALMPHTDPYDVVVVQLHGTKHWTSCIPAPEQPDAKHHEQQRGGEPQNHASLSPAQLGQLQEIRRERQQGCTAYLDDHLKGMRCSNFTLRQGDTMYLPKGIIHYALAGPEGSAHVTISLERRGITWADALAFGVSLAPATSNAALLQARWRKAVLNMVSEDVGVLYLEAMPTWALAPSSTACAAPASQLARDTLAEAFISSFVQRCNQAWPFFNAVSIAAGDLAAMAGHSSARALLDSVCTPEIAADILERLCTDGRLPVDTTSPSFRATVSTSALTEVRTFSEESKVGKHACVCVYVCVCVRPYVCVSVEGRVLRHHSFPSAF